MSNVRITVRRWTADCAEPMFKMYEQAPDGTWFDVSESAAASSTLETIMFVDPDGALDVETVGTAPPVAVLAAALPQSDGYLEAENKVETGVEVLDYYLGRGLTPVAINGQRWAPFPMKSANVWLECDPDELQRGTAAPVGQTIASAGCIEEDSMTSGMYMWFLLDVGSGYVCFVEAPDEDENTYWVEERHGRSNLELAQNFVNWVPGGPVSQAVVRAIEVGGEFDGAASDFDEEDSDSCKIGAYVDLTDSR